MANRSLTIFVAAGLGIAAVCPLALSQEPSAARTLEPEVVVPAGTVLPIVLSAYLNSRSTQVGDLFYADTLYPVWIQQRLVIPRGSIVKGTVTEVERPGRIRGKGRIAIRFDTILLPNGIERNMIAGLRSIHGAGVEKIDRSSETVEMDSSKGADVGQVAGPAGQGAIIGAIAGGGKGAAIGAGAGGAVGLATVLLSRGRELVLDPGTHFDIELKQPLRFAYAEIDFTQAELNNAGRLQQYRQRPAREEQRRGGYFGRGRFGFPGIIPWP